MKKISVLVILIIALKLSGNAQQTIRIIPGQTEINYLLSKLGGNSVAVQSVEISIEYFGVSPIADKTVTFKIAHQSNDSIGLNPAIVNVPVGGYLIKKNQFKTLQDTVKFKINISLNAVHKLTNSEYFDIQIVDSNSASAIHRINIRPVSLDEVSKPVLLYSIGFDSLKTITRSKSEDIIYPIYLKASIGSYKDSSNYKVIVSVNKDKSTLPPSGYSLDYYEKPFSNLDDSDKSKNVVYLTIKKDSLEDRAEKIVLFLEIKRGSISVANNQNNKKEVTLDINGIKSNDSLKAFNYLAYVGTNFDLVDGPRAKNLFFASNIFLPPSKEKTCGMYLSLYGNRTMSVTDTTGNIIRTTRIIGITDSTVKRFTEQSNLVRTLVSDNLGAYISPLIKMGTLYKENAIIHMYFSPSLEFVWRRTKINSLFSNSSNSDSVIEQGRFNGRIDYSNASTSNFNEFVFNIGFIGFTVVHESNDISVRINGSVGYSSTYTPLNQSITKGSIISGNVENNYQTSSDIFFCGRAWITEASTGITLQAEITNTLKHPRPFYGVTLSKAINFQNIGKIFQPITSR